MHQNAVTLPVDGLDIVGQLYLPDKPTPHPTVCICHGIPAHIPDPGDRGYALLAERICHEGMAVFIFNFRGTGASDGNLDILGWTRDLKTVINYLWTLTEVDRSHLSLLGFSGGAAVAVYVTSSDPRISSIVTCACPAEFNFLTNGGDPQSIADHFRNINAIRDNEFPHSIDEWLDGFRLISPITYVAEIAPKRLLLVHGSQDETVEVNDAHRLYAQAREPKQLIIVDDAGHRLRQDERTMTVVIDWLKSYVKIST